MNPVYLSEMSAAPIHGGGITLHRVLGMGLQRFQHYVQLFRSINDDGPEWPDKSRYLAFRFWPQATSVKRTIGCTLAYRFFSSNAVRRLHAYSLAKTLVKRGIITGGTRLLVCPQGVFTLYVMHKLQRLAEISYVTWFMDDHLVRCKEGEWKYGYDHERLMKEHLERAKQIFVISPQLAEFYRQRFGIKSKVLFGPCEQVQAPLYERMQTDGSCRLAYFGAFGPWQLDVLEALLPLIKNGTARLDLFTHGPAPIPNSFKDAGVIQRGHVNVEDVLKTMQRFDGVVLPISFRPEFRHMSYFNIATKMSECLGSGTPTLVIGPADSAMVRFLAPHAAAVIADDLREVPLKKAIEELCLPTVRRHVLSNAKKLVREQLNQDEMRRRWRPAAEYLTPACSVE